MNSQNRQLVFFVDQSQIDLEEGSLLRGQGPKNDAARCSPKKRLVVSLGSNPPPPPPHLSVFAPSCLPVPCFPLAWSFGLRKLREGAPMAAQPKTPWEFSCDLQVDFESDEKASMVYAALAVDKELQPDKVKRNMSVSDGKLSVRFEAVEARFLRASFSSFVDVLTLATKTIEEFGGGMVL